MNERVIPRMEDEFNQLSWEMREREREREIGENGEKKKGRLSN